MLPRKFIRKAIIAKFPNIKIYDVDVPIDVTPPKTFIKIEQMQLSQTDIDKECWSWNVNVQLDLYSINELGFYSTLSVDDLEDDIRNLFSNLDIENFRLEDIHGITSRDNNYDTQTHSINRRILNIIFKVNSYEKRLQNG